jgi:uncharacterized protein YjaZ
MPVLIAVAVRLALVAAPVLLYEPPQSPAVSPITIRPAYANDEDARRCGPAAGTIKVLDRLQSPSDLPEIAAALDRSNLPAIIEQAVSQVSRTLPAPPLTICVFAAPLVPPLTYLDGVGGVSRGQGQIQVFVHPIASASAKLPYTVAHEYHHEAGRLLAPFDGSPIANVIREGKADVFARLQYPSAPPIGHTALLADGEHKADIAALREYERNPGSFVFAEFMFGLRPDLPRWAGYRLGYAMVQSYVKARPGLSVAEWTAAAPRTIAEAYAPFSAR